MYATNYNMAFNCTLNIIWHSKYNSILKSLKRFSGFYPLCCVGNWSFSGISSLALYYGNRTMVINMKSIFINQKYRASRYCVPATTAYSFISFIQNFPIANNVAFTSEHIIWHHPAHAGNYQAYSFLFRNLR